MHIELRVLQTHSWLPFLRRVAKRVVGARNLSIRSSWTAFMTCETKTGASQPRHKTIENRRPWDGIRKLMSYEYSKVCGSYSSGYQIHSSARKYSTSHFCRQRYQKNKKQSTQRQSSKTVEEECFPVSESFWWYSLQIFIVGKCGPWALPLLANFQGRRHLEYEGNMYFEEQSKIDCSPSPSWMI